jgi:DNA adenine methylase
MSFLKWVGSKRKQVNEIIIHLPNKNRYLEPMLGGGSVMLALLANGYEGDVIVNDINPALIRTWLEIKHNVDDLIKELKKELEMPIDEHRYYELRSEYNKLGLGLRKSALFIILNKTCYKGLFRVNKKGEFNVPYGNYKKPKIYNEQQLRDISQLINKVAFYTLDYKLFLQVYANQDSAIYIDPPYEGTYNQYSINRFDDDEFKDHLLELRSKNIPFIVSNIDKWNVDWDVKIELRVKNTIDLKQRNEALYIFNEHIEK